MCVNRICFVSESNQDEWHWEDEVPSDWLFQIISRRGNHIDGHGEQEDFLSKHHHIIGIKWNKSVFSYNAIMWCKIDTFQTRFFVSVWLCLKSRSAQVHKTLAVAQGLNISCWHIQTRFLRTNHQNFCISSVFHWFCNPTSHLLLADVAETWAALAVENKEPYKLPDGTLKWWQSTWNV